MILCDIKLLGPVAWWNSNPGLQFSKQLVASKVHVPFYSSEVNIVGIEKSWEHDG